MIYVINPNGYFFAIEDDVPLVLEDLKQAGCEICPNRHIMYESVCMTSHMDLDEIAGGELVIKRSADGRLTCVEPRGIIDYIEYQRGGLTEYIVDWVL